MKTFQIEATPTQLKQINAFIEKIGAKIVKLEPKKTVAKKQELHPHIIELREDCKRIKNEIRIKYNETAKKKIKPIV